MRAMKSQSGVVLIEALLGILIFSIGILALIGMQATAIRNTADARYRSEASFLATEVIGRMWLDIGHIGDFDKDAPAFAPRDEWEIKVLKTLPGVDITGATRPTIEVDGVTGEVTVTVLWQQPGETTTRRLQMVNRIRGAASP
jgi:type IV pilus assembly protein PilV